MPGSDAPADLLHRLGHDLQPFGSGARLMTDMTDAGQ
jgi:hypothetical protein